MLHTSITILLVATTLNIFHEASSRSSRLGSRCRELFYGLNPISLDAFRTTVLKTLVNESAKFFSDFTKCRIITLNMRCTDLSLIWICLFIFLLPFSYFRISMVDLESVWTKIGSMGLGTIYNSDKRSFNHSASKQVVFRAMSLNSMVLLAITVCLQDFQDTATPPNINTYPVVDLCESQWPSWHHYMLLWHQDIQYK